MLGVNSAGISSPAPLLWAGLVTDRAQRQELTVFLNQSTSLDPVENPRTQATQVRQATRQLVVESARLREGAFDMRVKLLLDRLADSLAPARKARLADSSGLLDGLLEIALQLSRRQSGDVQLRVPGKSGLRPGAVRALPDGFVSFCSDTCHPAAARAEKAPSRLIVIADIASEFEHSGNAALEVMLQSGFRAMTAVPIVCARDGWCGWISTFDTQTEASHGDALWMLQALGRQLPAFLARETQETTY